MARKRNPIDPADAAAHGPQAIPRGAPVSRNTLMPGYRVRHDGWTEERTQRFLDALSHTGCVRDAARVAGVSNVAGYRLKKRYPAFAAAWDEALARAQQGLIAIAYKRAVEGRETVIYRQGQEVERRIQPSDSMLGLLIKRGDLEGGGDAAAAAVPDPETVLSLDEWKAGWRFDGWDKKVQSAAAEADTIDRLGEKLERVRRNLMASLEHEGRCYICDQPVSGPGMLPHFSQAELCAITPLETLRLAMVWDGTPEHGRHVAAIGQAMREG